MEGLPKNKNSTGLFFGGVLVFCLLVVGGSVVFAAVKGSSKPAPAEVKKEVDGKEPALTGQNITIEYQETGKLPQIKSLLQRSQVLEYGANALESAIKVKPFTVSVQECGDSKFVPFAPDKVVLCYESIATDISRFTARGLKREAAIQTSLYSALFGFIQRSSDVLISQYNVPYTGSREDAVDEFATLFSLNQIKAGDRVVKAGVLSLSLSDRTTKDSVKSDQRFNLQRGQFITCRMVGSDSEKYQGLVAQLKMTSDRVVECERAYKQSLNSWNLFLKDAMQ